jgi:hypothetical protein
MFIEIQKIDSNYYPEVCLVILSMPMPEHTIWILRLSQSASVHLAFAADIKSTLYNQCWIWI